MFPIVRDQSLHRPAGYQRCIDNVEPDYNMPLAEQRKNPPAN